MLASHGKVLSPGNEGSMAMIVYVFIFPQLCLICVHMPISGLPLWAILVHAHVLSVNAGPQHPWKPAVWIGFGLYLGFGVLQGLCVKEPIFLLCCGKLCRIGQEHADSGEEPDPRSDGLWWKGYSRGQTW